MFFYCSVSQFIQMRVSQLFYSCINEKFLERGTIQDNITFNLDIQWKKYASVKEQVLMKEVLQWLLARNRYLQFRLEQTPFVTLQKNKNKRIVIIMYNVYERGESWQKERCLGIHSTWFHLFPPPIPYTTYHPTFLFLPPCRKTLRGRSRHRLGAFSATNT